MSLLVLLLISALDLAAIFFNVRMLLICFKYKAKHKFLQKFRVLAIFQCACQVTILVSETIGWWKGFDVKPNESCDVFRVLSLSVMFFQACNLTAIMTAYHGHPVAHENGELFANLRMSAALIVGFVGSAVIWWYNCYSHAPISRLALKVAFVVTVSFVVLLMLAAALTTNAEEQREITSPESDTAINTWSLLWNICKESKKPLFFTALLSACLVMILSGEPRSESLLCQDFEQDAFFKEILYSAITKFAVGIVLPVTLYDLIKYSSSEGNKDKTTVSVI